MANPQPEASRPFEARVLQNQAARCSPGEALSSIRISAVAHVGNWVVLSCHLWLEQENSARSAKAEVRGESWAEESPLREELLLRQSTK